VVFNAVNAAKAREVDILIVDTAGRLHTKFNLMEEMKKMTKVVEKAIDRGPDQIWLVIDSNTGQNAINQAQKFNEDVGLTGLILTKLDAQPKAAWSLQSPTNWVAHTLYWHRRRHSGPAPLDAKAFTEALF
jgi:fused signal recognition particle receptor